MPLCMLTTDWGPSGGAKRRGKARLQLGREVDLRHHHQGLGLRIGLQGALHGAQVDLGLAAAGAAVQQKGAGVLRDLVDHVALLGAQGDGRLGRGGQSGHGFHRRLAAARADLRGLLGRRRLRRLAAARA